MSASSAKRLRASAHRAATTSPTGIATPAVCASPRQICTSLSISASAKPKSKLRGSTASGSFCAVAELRAAAGVERVEQHAGVEAALDAQRDRLGGGGPAPVAESMLLSTFTSWPMPGCSPT